MFNSAVPVCKRELKGLRYVIRYVPFLRTTKLFIQSSHIITCWSPFESKTVKINFVQSAYVNTSRDKFHYFDCLIWISLRESIFANDQITLIEAYPYWSFISGPILKSRWNSATENQNIFRIKFLSFLVFFNPISIKKTCFLVVEPLRGEG